LGGYAYDRDPARPNWYSVFPERNFANPADGAVAL
jgi:glucarate dehydratase